LICSCVIDAKIGPQAGIFAAERPVSVHYLCFTVHKAAFHVNTAVQIACATTSAEIWKTDSGNTIFILQLRSEDLSQRGRKKGERETLFRNGRICKKKGPAKEEENQEPETSRIEKETSPIGRAPG